MVSSIGEREEVADSMSYSIEYLYPQPVQAPFIRGDFFSDVCHHSHFGNLPQRLVGSSVAYRLTFVRQLNSRVILATARPCNLHSQWSLGACLLELVYGSVQELLLGPALVCGVLASRLGRLEIHSTTPHLCRSVCLLALKCRKRSWTSLLPCFR